MKFGIIPTEGGALFADALAEVMLAEELGFDSVWMEEHHAVTGHYWPSPLVVLTAFGARTERILLGTDVIVTPFYHPVRLAEDVAVIESMTGDRLILGAAIGYRPDEFALYDAEFDRRGAQLEELIAILRPLWRGETVDHEGRFYTVRGRDRAGARRGAAHLDRWLGPDDHQAGRDPRRGLGTWPDRGHAQAARPAGSL